MARVVCRIYVHISRISNTLLQATFHSSSVFNENEPNKVKIA